MAKKQSKKAYLALLVILCISVGFAALSSVLNINGTTTVTRQNWNMTLENITETAGLEANGEAIYKAEDDTKQTVEYTATLAQPGDKYEFTVDVTNGGTLAAILSSVTNKFEAKDSEDAAVSSETLAKYCTVSATWADGSEIATDSVIEGANHRVVKVTVAYKDGADIAIADLPTKDVTVTGTLQLTYDQINAKDIVEGATAGQVANS